jgi:hypothetical protein
VNDPVMLRRYVREVMAMAPERKYSVKKIFDAVSRLTRDPLQVDELQQALQWNAARDYIVSEHDEDEGSDLWSLTKWGKIKQGLAA